MVNVEKMNTSWNAMAVWLVDLMQKDKLILEMLPKQEWSVTEFNHIKSILMSVHNLNIVATEYTAVVFEEATKGGLQSPPQEGIDSYFDKYINKNKKHDLN